jgi:NADH:ubiquinone oxidoreductase subunit 6 (subunit J)
MDVIAYVLFAALAAIVIVAGAGVVVMTRVTGSALSMGLSFLGMAGLFALLGAETIAFFQVLIYVGAITVLILYGVMLTRVAPPGANRALFFQRQAGWALIPLTFIGVVATVFALSFRSDVAQTPGSDLEPLANAIFRDYAFPFEVASVLLLAAMIGAIALVRRGDE